jgi:hypothetical protein
MAPVFSIAALGFLNNQGDQDVRVNGLGWAIEPGSGKLPGRKTRKMAGERLNNGGSVIFFFNLDANC